MSTRPLVKVGGRNFYKTLVKKQASPTKNPIRLKLGHHLDKKSCGIGPKILKSKKSEKNVLKPWNREFNSHWESNPHQAPDITYSKQAGRHTNQLYLASQCPRILH